MNLDLHQRCVRECCNKLIRSKQDKANYERYPGYCSYNCQEWDRLERASDHVRNMPEYMK